MEAILLHHPSAVMPDDSQPASAPPSAGRPSHLRRLDANCHVRAIIAVLEAADTALGIDDPARKPSTYRELAEEVVGRLDPHIRRVAEYRACEVMLAAIEETASGPRLSREQRTEALRQACLKALTHFSMTCEGRLPASFIDARRVDAEGRVI